MPLRRQAVENIIQALARIVVMDAAVRIRKRFAALSPDLWLNLQVHDELVYVVPDRWVEQCKQIMTEEMYRRPWWAPDLPLKAECKVGQSFGETK